MSNAFGQVQSQEVAQCFKELEERSWLRICRKLIVASHQATRGPNPMTLRPRPANAFCTSLRTHLAPCNRNRPSFPAGFVRATKRTRPAHAFLHGTGPESALGAGDEYALCQPLVLFERMHGQPVRGRVRGGRVQTACTNTYVDLTLRT